MGNFTWVRPAPVVTDLFVNTSCTGWQKVPRIGVRGALVSEGHDGPVSMISGA